MKIHEHQGKEILARYDVPVPRGRVAFSVDEAVEMREKSGQIPGRGKGTDSRRWPR